MLLSEHYKLTIGDDKFVDYFTFPTKKKETSFAEIVVMLVIGG